MEFYQTGPGLSNTYLSDLRLEKALKRNLPNSSRLTLGAARAVELYGDAYLKQNAFKNLTSKDPALSWTSGQWMTERTGGSDVSQTSTVAVRKTCDGGFDWSLSGVKWFTSATTSQMAMLLARPEGAESGSRGLSLFYTELRDQAGALQNIEILRLKKKLGTDALPTAELRLTGTPASPRNSKCTRT